MPGQRLKAIEHRLEQVTYHLFQHTRFTRAQAVHVQVALVLQFAQGFFFQHRKVTGQADGDRREQDVKRDGERELNSGEIEKFDHLPEPRIDGPSAYVSVMEGCSKYCTFCVVPYTRGEEVSRPFDDVLSEIIHLAENGVREVTLLGQNVNGYRGLTDAGRLADLAELIRVVAAVDGIERIRYTTSHPLEFSDSLIQAHAEVPELVKHLHLPVQSGSDRILAAMKRNHTALEYKSKLRKLRAAVPGICISSDFIVGFPGETEKDFEQTMKLIEDVGFDFSYSFVYSQRPGTPAADLADDTPKALTLSECCAV